MTIPLRPSRLLTLVLALAHLAALLVALSMALPSLHMGLLAAGIAASALHTLQRIRYPAVTALRIGKAGELEIETKVGASDTATVMAQTAVLPGVIVLLLRRGGRVTALTLPIDATGAQAHRQLRLWLKWQAVPA
jgi:hypothetical protein